MIVFLVFVGILVALVAVGVLNTRQHRKQMSIDWDDGRGVVPRTDSETRYPRPHYGSFWGGGGAGGGS